MKSNPRVFVICGAAGSGKSTLVKLATQKFEVELEIYKKFSERAGRGPGDDIRHVSKIEIGDYDLAYEAMGNKYGISIDEIEAKLAKNKNVILPTTDFRAVERMKYFFKDRCVSLCVVSTIDTKKFDLIHKNRYGFKPSPEQQNEMARHFSKMYSATRLDKWPKVYEFSTAISELVNQSIPESDSLEIRKTKIRNFQTRLFERPDIFDHLILNYRDGYPEDMLVQFCNVYDEDASKDLSKSAPVLYVISSASGHGKGKLAEALRIIAPNEILVVEKEAKREAKINDKEDGLIPIGKNGTFSPNFDFTFFSHRTATYKGTEYAFDLKRVHENLNNGKTQILVANSLSNSNLHDRLRKEFPEHMVHLYLWRFQTEAELRSYQIENCATKAEAEARIKQTSDIYQSYVHNINKVDFVLLNTSFYEDLHNQVFSLLTHHRIYS